MNADEMRKWDEATTELNRTIPSFLWTFFEELKNQGFTDPQALELTKEYMGKVLKL